MGRKATVSRLSPEAKKWLYRQLREDRLTLPELKAQLESEFPGDITISRSALGRARSAFEEEAQAMAARVREIEAVTSTLVGELGEEIGEKAGTFLGQAVTTLAIAATTKAGQRDDVTPKEVGELARAARAAMQASGLSLKQRQVIEDIARKKLLEEQRAKLEAMPVKGGVTPETKAAIRRELGIV